MLTLTANECRVLGVLIEKAQTTPQQYPLTLNALASGANQKNNREPLTNLNQEQVLEALDGLRNKALAREVMLSGSRVEKFRHVAREVLEVSTGELVILAELLLRGPQTIGELRGRASRMHPLESTDIVKNLVDNLMLRPDSGQPLVRELAPLPGDRANRYAQLLCPNLHPIDAAAASHPHQQADAAVGSVPAAHADHDLERRVRKLEQHVAQLQQTVSTLAAATDRAPMATAINEALLASDHSETHIIT